MNIQQYGDCNGVARKAGRCHGVVWEGTRNLQEDICMSNGVLDILSVMGLVSCGGKCFAW
jgi:hypothetical protein